MPILHLLGYLAGFCVLVVVVCALLASFSEKVLPESKRGCPRCGKTLIIGWVYAWCEACGTYARSEPGGFVEVPPGFVASMPVFAARLKDLRTPTHWTLPWSGACCVCRGLAAPQDGLNVRVEGLSMVPGFARFDVFRVPFGTCKNHREGVSSDDSSVLFASYDYYREFLAANLITPVRVFSTASKPEESGPVLASATREVPPSNRTGAAEAEALLRSAQAKLSAGDTIGALRDYEQGLSLYEGPERREFQNGWELYTAKRVSESLKMFETASPGHPAVNALIAWIATQVPR